MTEQKRLDPHSVDIDTNPSSNQEFSAVLAMRLSRRRALSVVHQQQQWPALAV
jgi:hypothetical protein